MPPRLRLDLTPDWPFGLFAVQTQLIRRFTGRFRRIIAAALSVIRLFFEQSLQFRAGSRRQLRRVVFRRPLVFLRQFSHSNRQQGSVLLEHVEQALSTFDLRFNGEHAPGHLS